MTRRIGLLGSTGSVGTQTLDVVRNFPEELEVAALSTHTRTDRLEEQVEEFDPEAVGVSDPGTAVREDWLEGSESLRTLARMDLDVLVVAVTGMAGLLPTLDALGEGTVVALASKEAMVVGGPLVRRAEETSRGRVVPLDSEHHAVFQLLRGEDAGSVERVFLTASGGPFRDRSRSELDGVTPEEALDHPNWEMGNKITVDSATMMNTGLELIEAKYLFDLEFDQLDALLHRQSLVHALLEFNDASVKAQMGRPDMRQSIQSALLHPERRSGPVESLNFSEALALNFEPVDGERFPAFALAREALESGGYAPAVLNAANSEAVRAFLNERLAFLEIPAVIEICLEENAFSGEVTLDGVLEADEWARDRARDAIEALD